MSLINVARVFLKVDLSISQSIEKYEIGSRKFDHNVILRSTSAVAFVTRSIGLK